MKTWILPAALTVLAVMLVTAVFSPDAVRAVVAVPKGWLEARQAASLRDEIRAAWTDTERLAYAGNADAMYRLGMKMRFPSDQAFSGVTIDYAAGMRLIEAAAGRGHVDAALAVWKEDGQDTAELLRIAGAALENADRPEELGALADWLQWIAVQRCEEPVSVAASQVYEAVSTSGRKSARPDDDSRYRTFRETYERRCLAG